MKVALERIIRSSKLIEDFCLGLNYTDFLDEELVKSAVAWQLILIGNTIEKRLTDDFKTKFKRVNWSDAGKMRHFLAHESEGEQNLVDWKMVWFTVSSDLPAFKKQIQRIVSKLP